MGHHRVNNYSIDWGLRGQRNNERIKKINETINENFPSLARYLNIKIKDALILAMRYNAKRFSIWCIIFQVSKLKDKQRILKPAR